MTLTVMVGVIFFTMLTIPAKPCYAFTMRKELLGLLTNGEYAHGVVEAPLTMTNTRGLWQGTMIVNIPGEETIHGNPVKIEFDWLQIGVFGKTVAEDVVFRAHGFATRISADKFWEELRKHI